MLYSGKVVVLVQEWLKSSKSGFIRVKVVVARQVFCIRANVFVFGQSCCIRAKEVVFVQSGCIRAKGVVFG